MQVFRTLTEQNECRVEEDHLMPDHVYMLLSVPPKYSVSQVVGLHAVSGMKVGKTMPFAPATGAVDCATCSSTLRAPQE